MVIQLVLVANEKNNFLNTGKIIQTLFKGKSFGTFCHQLEMFLDR